MIGFILKDFLSLRSYLLRQMGLMLLASLSVSIGLRNFGMVPIFIIMCFMVTMVSCFSLDESTKWDAFALTLPVARHDIVRAKYGFFLGGTVMFSLFSGVLSAGLSTLLFQSGGKELLLVSIAFCGIFIPVFCICLPLLLKLGVTKARLWMMLASMSPFFVFLVLMQNYKFTSYVLSESFWLSFTAGQVALYALLALAVLAICVVASYKISVKLYHAKEF